MDALDDISGVATAGLSVVFDSTVSSATAEHYSVENQEDRSSPNSVLPEYACLTASGGAEA